MSPQHARSWMDFVGSNGWYGGCRLLHSHRPHSWGGNKFAEPQRHSVIKKPLARPCLARLGVLPVVPARPGDLCRKRIRVRSCESGRQPRVCVVTTHVTPCPTPLQPLCRYATCIIASLWCRPVVSCLRCLLLFHTPPAHDWLSEEAQHCLPFRTSYCHSGRGWGWSLLAMHGREREREA